MRATITITTKSDNAVQEQEQHVTLPATILVEIRRQTWSERMEITVGREETSVLRQFGGSPKRV